MPSWQKSDVEYEPERSFFFYYFHFKPGQIIVHLKTLYRDPANIHQTLYPDGKNCAVPSLHRDKISAKVPGSVPVLALGNAYYHNRRAVSVHFQTFANLFSTFEITIINISFLNQFFLFSLTFN